MKRARLDAFHLPALPGVSTTGVVHPGPDGAEIEVHTPELTPELLDHQIDALRAAWRRHLSERPVERIVEVIDGVARRFLDPADPLRANALAAVAAVTGMSPPMVEAVLDGMAADWRADALWRALDADFPDSRALDGYVADAATGRRSRAYGPPLLLHVFSGNVPGVAVTSIIRALLVKSASLGKTGSGETILAPLFARALHEADPELGACVAVAYWTGGNEPLEDRALAGSDGVIVYGGGDAVEGLRARIPATVPFHAYSHRLSFAVIARESLAPSRAGATAGMAAEAVAMFDQRGCVSPHLFYVEEGAGMTPREWAKLLAKAMESLEHRLPRGRLQPLETAAILQLRGEVEFARIAGSEQEMYTSGADSGWTVIYDPDPVFEASCLNRVVRVKPIPSLDSVIEQIAPIASVLQTVGYAGDAARLGPLAETLGRLGASRVAPLDRMAWPPPGWHHDGRPALASLVRWCDWEA